MNSHQRRKARRRARMWLDLTKVEMTRSGADVTYTVRLRNPAFHLAAFCLAFCMACGTGTEGEDAGALIEDAGQTDAGEYIADAGGLGTDAGELDACEERQAQWCRQGCIGTIGIDRDCPELDCEC